MYHVTCNHSQSSRCLDVGENPLWALNWGTEENLLRLGHTLQLLRLDACCLSILPDTIGSLTSLTTLDVSCNRLLHINPYVCVT
jgi:Leucine-rich repeat (LRR) protein